MMRMMRQRDNSRSELLEFSNLLPNGNHLSSREITSAPLLATTVALSARIRLSLASREVLQQRSSRWLERKSSQAISI